VTDPSIFKAYDLRGTYGEQMDEALAYRIGRAFPPVLERLEGTPVDEQRLAIGRDMRLSAPSMAEQYARGMADSGAHVLDVGMVGTEMLYWTVGSRDLDGGLMCTASHNPKAYTGAKLVKRGALALSGDSGIKVRRIQARLRQIGWYFGDVTGSYGPSTRTAVLGFQGKRGIPQTGIVDRRTLVLLLGMTTDPTADELANRPPDPADGRPLDPRCRTGLALCIDKNSRSLRWVVDGKVRLTVDVRFGSAELPTREGVFSVYLKSRDHVSSLYHTSMPFAMFFSGGQAVHYSPDFAATGYYGASHGCVNVRDYSAMASLFDRVPIGTRVVIYWS